MGAKLDMCPSIKEGIPASTKIVSRGGSYRFPLQTFSTDGWESSRPLETWSILPPFWDSAALLFRLLNLWQAVNGLMLIQVSGSAGRCQNKWGAVSEEIIYHSQSDGCSLSDSIGAPLSSGWKGENGGERIVRVLKGVGGGLMKGKLGLQQGSP